MPAQPAQQPKRPKGFFESVMLDWRTTGLRCELTDQETVTLAAKFLGLAIAAMDIPIDSQVDVMAASVGIVHSAWDGRTQVKRGTAWPIQTNIRGPGGIRH